MNMSVDGSYQSTSKYLTCPSKNLYGEDSSLACSSISLTSEDSEMSHDTGKSKEQLDEDFDKYLNVLTDYDEFMRFTKNVNNKGSKKKKRSKSSAKKGKKVSKVKKESTTKKSSADKKEKKGKKEKSSKKAKSDKNDIDNPQKSPKTKVESVEPNSLQEIGIYTEEKFYSLKSPTGSCKSDMTLTPNLGVTIRELSGKKKEADLNKIVQVFEDPNFQTGAIQGPEIININVLKSKFETLAECGGNKKTSASQLPLLASLFYQVAQDFHIVSSCRSLTSEFMRSNLQDHVNLLLSHVKDQSAAWLSATKKVRDKATDCDLVNRLEACMINMPLCLAATRREQCQSFDQDLIDIAEFMLAKHSLIARYRIEPNKAIRTLYHSFFVPNKIEFKTPFYRDEKDQRIRRIEILCHCRISVGATNPCATPPGNLFCEIYYDFMLGNHFGAIDMLYRLLEEATDDFKIPVKHHRTIICFPSGEKLIFKDFSWIQGAVPLIKKKEEGPCVKFSGKVK